MKTRSMLCWVLFLATFVKLDADGVADSSSKALRLADLNAGLASAKHGAWGYSFDSQAPMGSNESLRIRPNGLVDLIVAANIPAEYLGVWRVDDKGLFRIDILGAPDPYIRIKIFKENGRFMLKGIREFRNSGADGGVAAEPLVVPFGPFKLSSAYYEAEMEQFAACPVCRYFAMADYGMVGSVCKVCFWRNDSHTVSSADGSILADVASEMNFGLTIQGARKNFHEFGACHKDVLNLVVPPEQRGSYKRQDPVEK